jgi:nitroimidazol reductase NimA-like FMN-containing flavoprotein (pyridoxamine 5'-phosphate oxidase superfamily)
MEEITRTERTRVRRFAKYANYERKTIYSIIDRALICHVGFVADGAPRVIPTLLVRIDDQIYLHGSTGNQMLRTAAEGKDICVTVTHVDGIVLARSALYHTMNYRSAVIFGRATVIAPERKPEIMRALVEHIVPGRWTGTRQPTIDELATTQIVALSLTEASAKIRSGHPSDAEEDYHLPHWAGVIPIRIQTSTPIPDAQLKSAVPMPDHVRDYRLPDAREDITD